MENSKRRAIGLLVVFATVLTVIGTWNLPETGSGEREYRNFSRDVEYAPLRMRAPIWKWRGKKLIPNHDCFGLSS